MTTLSPTPTSFLVLPRVPPASGQSGYYTYSSEPRQYGTLLTVRTLVEVSTQLRINGVPDVGVGDISFAQGGTMLPHSSHKHGRNVDLRPLRKDRRHEPVNIHQAQYDRDATRLLVAALLAHKNVRSILFNDPQVDGVHWHAGHDNHLHINFHH